MKKIFLLLIFFQPAFLLSQIVYTDNDEEVNQFIKRLSLRNIIELNDEVKPYSRKYIAELLYKAAEVDSLLSNTERDELKWYSREYDYELQSLSLGDSLSESLSLGEGLGRGQSESLSLGEGLGRGPGRWRLYRYQDSSFLFSVYPVAGYGTSNAAGKTGYNKVIGAGFYGTYSDWFGASFEYADFGEFGDNVDRKKDLTHATGVNYKEAPNGIELVS